MGDRRHFLSNADRHVHLQRHREDVLPDGPAAPIPQDQGGHLDLAVRHQDHATVLRVPLPNHATRSEPEANVARDAEPSVFLPFAAERGDTSGHRI